MNRNEMNLGKHLLPAPVGGGFSMKDYWVWCGSVVRGEDGNYHMFASRWKKTLPFHPGWAVGSEIVRAVSKTPEGPYTFAEVVLPARGAAYWDGRVTHNPAIHKCGDTYVLFYIGTTFPYPDIEESDHLNHHSYQWLSARSNKRIGIATATSVFGPWERRDEPILSPRPDCFDNFLTSNPAPCIGPDGSCLLVYKTRSYREPPYGPGDMFSDMMLGAAFAERYDGPYRRLTDRPLFSVSDGVLEDPFVWRTDTGYTMIAKDWKGTYTGDVGALVYAASKNGVDWKVADGVAISRDILWDDGVTRTMGNMDRPFLLFDEKGAATHLFVATNDGTEAGFATMTKSWNACIPLSE